MNRAAGVVVRVEDGFAWVRTEAAAPACGSCARREGCGQAGQGLLDSLFVRQENLLRLPNTIGARPGDAVSVCSADGSVLRAAAIVYGLPLLLGFAGAMLLDGRIFGEAGAALGLLFGLAGGFFLARIGHLAGKANAPILSIGHRPPQQDSIPSSFHWRG